MEYSENYQQILKKIIKTSRVLWFYLTGFILIYVLAAYYVTFSIQEMKPEAMVLLRYCLYCLGTLVASLVLMLKRYSISKKRISAQLNKASKASDFAVKFFTKRLKPDLLNKMISLTEKELKLIGLASRYFLLFVVILALCEAIAIWGLILAWMNKPLEILPFAAVSILLCLSIYNGPVRVVEVGKMILKNKNIS